MNTKKTPPARARILIVDDHPMTRAGLVHLIGSQPDLTVCAEAETAAAGLTAVEKTRPDLVLADVTLPDRSGIELIKDIKAVQPALPVLVISMHDESLYAERALKAGAAGYIMKVEGGAKLLAAIRHVLSGEIYVSEKISARILHGFTGRPVESARTSVGQLTDREFEVFSLLGHGLPTRGIGERLHVSAKTVEAHRANIKAKLGLRTAPELVAYAARWIAAEGEKG